MYYIYKIENIQIGKKYIGLTNNAERRRSRHFTDLKCHRHDNSFLQKEYDIFGKDNFSFEIIFAEDCTPEQISQKEIEFIEKYDSYYNGYNQNKGGNFGPANGGTHLTKSDLFNICAALEFCSRPGGVLSQMFDVTTTTISRIKHKVNHCETIAEYDNLPKKEREEIYQIFCESSSFYNKKIHQTILKSKRKLSQEQVYMVLPNAEFKVTTKKFLQNKFNISSSYTFDCILLGKTYKDYYSEYQLLSREEKQKIVSLLREQ